METHVCLPAGDIWVRQEGYILLVWGPKSQDSDQARAVFEQVLLLLQHTGYRKLLTDQRLRATATEEYMGWLLADWLTRVGNGQYLSQVAVVVARPLDLRLQAVDVCREGQARYGIISHYFSSVESAQQWLQLSEVQE
jgi:hypothetical protein